MAYGCTGSTMINSRPWRWSRPEQDMTRPLDTGKQLDIAPAQRRLTGHFRLHRLLELPMHVMDTALFYPDYLGLSSREARASLAGWSTMQPSLGAVLRSTGMIAVWLRSGCGMHVIVTWCRT